MIHHHDKCVPSVFHLNICLQYCYAGTSLNILGLITLFIELYYVTLEAVRGKNLWGRFSDKPQVI
jgi:hypothetical protein